MTKDILALWREDVFLFETPAERRRFGSIKGKFRAALSVFQRKMEAGADKTEPTFAVGKYVCGGRLKELFEKSSLRNFKNFGLFSVCD